MSILSKDALTLKVLSYNNQKGTTSVPLEVKRFLAKLLSFSYGVVIHGKPYTDFENAYVDLSEYRTLTTTEFQKYQVGICFDFVNYEAKWFMDHEYSFRTFYLAFSGATNHTHTILLFVYHDHVYWLEASWRKYSGIREFDSYNDALRVIGYLFYKEYSSGYDYVYRFHFSGKDHQA